MNLKFTDSLDPTKVLGIDNLINVKNISGPRIHLTNSYFEQCLIPTNSEIPRLYTGYEKEFGLYNDSLNVSKVQYEILHRIEKFKERPGYHYILIVRDINAGHINIIENTHYKSLAEDHGYFNEFVDVDYKGVGAIINHGEVISKSSGHDQNLNYKYGLNANVAYISRKENIEDGIIISDEFAERAAYTEITTIELTLGFNDILLNLYGNDQYYKSFPNVFEDVKNGLFCVKRSIDRNSMGCSTTSESLKHTNTDDDLIYGNGCVLDYEVYINSNTELVKDNSNRDQIIDIYNNVLNFKAEVCAALKPYVESRAHTLTVEANNKYYTYKAYVDSTMSQTNDKSRYTNGVGIFEFAYIKFTLGRVVKLGRGSKLTNRSGCKGVVCAVLPKRLMPIDFRGNYADIILNPYGVVGRSNPSQSYEQELNFICSEIGYQMKNTPSLEGKYKLVQKLYMMTDLDHSLEFSKYYNSLSISDKTNVINDMIDNWIHVRQHPFENISFEGLKSLYMEFGIRPKKITVGMNVQTKDGYVDKFYKSINTVIIGSEYILILKHTTPSKFSAVGISDINSIGIPHKNAIKSKNVSIRATPIKLGEMELNILINRVGPGLVNRFMAGNGSNLQHRDRVSKMLLEEDPFMYHDVNISTNDIMNSIASDAFVAIMRQLGYVVYSDTVEKEISYYSKD